EEKEIPAQLCLAAGAVGRWTDPLARRQLPLRVVIVRLKRLVLRKICGRTPSKSSHGSPSTRLLPRELPALRKHQQLEVEMRAICAKVREAAMRAIQIQKSDELAGRKRRHRGYVCPNAVSNHPRNRLPSRSVSSGFDEAFQLPQRLQAQFDCAK